MPTSIALLDSGVGCYTGPCTSLPLVERGENARERARLLALLHHQYERVRRVPVKDVTWLFSQLLLIFVY